MPNQHNRTPVIGTLLNERFRLEEKIGSGGMSTVYRAWDPTLERWVAIKLMHRDISEEPDQLERFRREARAVARLSHPHVVTVIDFGEDDGTPYIVLEYVEGETLKERIKRMGRLPVAEAVAYGIEIGRALTCAHEAQLVHRDVKPQNVLIDMEGRAKVTDFGIARSLEVDAAGLTADGRVLGTTDYVSPEQALGKQVTEQSDVYSLGIVMFEMLTGEVPFRAESQVAVAMKHVKEPLPDVQRIRPEASATLASVVEHATAKELGNRYATAEDLTEDLEEVLAIEVARTGEAGSEATSVLQALDHDTKGFVPVRLRNPRRWLLSVLAVLVLAGGAVAYFASRTEKGAGPPSTPRPCRWAPAPPTTTTPRATTANRPTRPRTCWTATRPRSGTPSATTAGSRASASPASACSWTPAARWPGAR
jgi:serine/threonine protein kinase